MMVVKEASDGSWVRQPLQKNRANQIYYKNNLLKHVYYEMMIKVNPNPIQKKLGKTDKILWCGVEYMLRNI